MRIGDVTSIVRRQRVRASVAELFAALVRFETMHRWFVGVRRVAAEGPLEPGAFRTVTLANGRGYREQITRFEPGRAFSYSVLDPPMGFRCWSADIDVEQEGSDALVVWRIHYRFVGLLGRLADRCVIAPVLSAVLTLSLSRLRRAVERHAIHRPRRGAGGE